MASFDKKISNIINSQVPEFVLSDHPKFLSFLKQYYTFMESGELVLKDVQDTDGIILETETNRSDLLLLDAGRIGTGIAQEDAGDKVILETSSIGKFTIGEVVTGATSNATATVLVENLDSDRLYISHQDKFIDGEIVTGNSSGASATIVSYKPNPVTTIQDLVHFKDPDKVISSFLTKMRNEFLTTLPENLSGSVSKQNLIKSVKSMYRAKGTTRAHEVFFKLLFNEDSETIFPREEMLRTSDGKFSTEKIMRAVGTSGDTNDLIGRTITGQTSEATAIIENVFKFNVSGTEVTEFILNADTLSGTFQIDEEVRGTQTDESETFIKATVTGIPSTVSITNDGFLYNENDTVSSSGGGEGAIFEVSDIGSSGITEIIVESGGNGYAIGDTVTFTNTSSGGSASGFVSVVNGGIRLEEGTESESTSHIVLEDATQDGDPYAGDKIVQEHGTGTEDITDVFISNQGFGYTSLPTLTITTNSGSSASLLAHAPEIGRIQKVKVVEHGLNYEDSPTPPELTFPTYLIYTSKSGTFTTGETVSATGSDGSTTITATFASDDSDTNVIKLTGATGTFGTDVTLTGASSEATVTIKKVDQATGTVTVAAVVDTDGVFLNEDGHLSETTMRIQDSLYYQDFSYVIRVGRSINDWRKSFKDTMHSSGFYVTGRINIQTQLDAKLQPIEGAVTSTEYTGIAGIINTLFSTILGRRLGTVDDGTSLRSNPELGVGADLTDSTSEHFTANTRDVTLKRQHIIKQQSKERIEVRGIETKFGAGSGQRMRSINKYWRLYSGSDNPQTSAVGGDSTETKYISPMQFANWATLRINGTQNTSLDGEITQFRDLTHKKLKTNLAFPTEIRVNYN